LSEISQPGEAQPDQLKADGAYHHGDLPATLMELALQHIAREGTEKLSLRALAREAGVSATAPYKHFPTKRCLLAALATRGFRALGAAVRNVPVSTADLEGSFVNMGMAYVNFATGNPTAYQIMFGTVIEDFSEYPELAEAAEESFDPVRRLIDLALAHQPDWDMTPELLGGVIWTTVHGMASLLIFAASRLDMDKAMERRPNQALAALIQEQERALRIHIRGVLLQGEPGTS
jgi:AcrR family transcriptional regulator